MQIFSLEDSTARTHLLRFRESLDLLYNVAEAVAWVDADCFEGLQRSKEATT